MTDDIKERIGRLKKELTSSDHRPHDPASLHAVRKLLFIVESLASEVSYIYQDNEGAAFLRAARNDVDALHEARKLWPNATSGHIRRWNGERYVTLSED